MLANAEQTPIEPETSLLEGNTTITSALLESDDEVALTADGVTLELPAHCLVAGRDRNVHALIDGRLLDLSAGAFQGLEGDGGQFAPQTRKALPRKRKSDRWKRPQRDVPDRPLFLTPDLVLEPLGPTRQRVQLP